MIGKQFLFYLISLGCHMKGLWLPGCQNSESRAIFNATKKQKKEKRQKKERQSYRVVKSLINVIYFWFRVNKGQVGVVRNETRFEYPSG